MLASLPAIATSATPSLSALKVDIYRSVSIQSTPDLTKTIPPLTSMSGADASLTPIRSQCYPGSASVVSGVPSHAATICAYGDTSATRTMLLTGDSQAGMWLPAFDQLGRDLGWKVVFLAHPECPPWGVPNPPRWIIRGQFTVSDCSAYQVYVQRWVRSAKPQVVLLAGRAHPVGSNANSPLDPAVIGPRVLDATKAFNVPGVKVITLSPMPSYTPSWTPYSPTTCFAYIKPITKCLGTPVEMTSPVLLKAEQDAARSLSTTLLNINPLFCTAKLCALFVHDPVSNSSRLVDYDNFHMNRYYAVWISSALESLIAPKLPA